MANVSFKTNRSKAVPSGTVKLMCEIPSGRYTLASSSNTSPGTTSAVPNVNAVDPTDEFDRTHRPTDLDVVGQDTGSHNYYIRGPRLGVQPPENTRLWGIISIDSDWGYGYDCTSPNVHHNLQAGTQ